ncbi:MAG: hypothetical protein ABR529_06155 [Actinomycetota bacterium]
MMVLVALLSMTIAAACSGGSDDQQATGATKQPEKVSKKDGSSTGKGSSPKDKTFRVSGGKVTLRKVGFERLRISNVATSKGWRSRIDDNNDDSVGVDFFKAGRNLELTAELDVGRLRVEACEDVSQTGTDVTVAEAGTVTLQRLVDEDLRVARVTTRGAWRSRITDNNSEDVEVVFTSKSTRIDFDAQFDDGRIEASFCRTLN